ncbi:diguanylate cyclase [Achromobacter xylosoxidans]
MLLLPRTEGRQALAIAERLRKSVAALRLPHQDNGGGIVTLSIGVASALPEPGQVAASLVEAADAAVYRAKEASTQPRGHGRYR